MDDRCRTVPPKGGVFVLESPIQDIASEGGIYRFTSRSVVLDDSWDTRPLRSQRYLLHLLQAALCGELQGKECHRSFLETERPDGTVRTDHSLYAKPQQPHLDFAGR